jgi:hypothetical protein
MKTKIENYLKMFEIKEVERNGEKKNIVVFTDNASEDLKDSVRKAHGERLPSDWIFDKFHSILDAMLQYDDDNEDMRYEIVDGLVDVYTSGLTEWLNSSNHNVYYLSEAIENGAEDGFKALALAQYKAIDEIYSEVLNLLNK